MQYVLCKIEDDGSSSFVSKHPDLLEGMAAGKKMVGEIDYDFAYGLFTDDGHKLTTFGKGRIGYREWAHRRGYISSLDDKYEHDVDVALS